MCPHTPIYASSYCYTCVRILLYVCAHTKSQSGLSRGQQRAGAPRTIVTCTILTRTRTRGRGGGAEFTCFTRIKVQILAQELQRQRPHTSPATPATESARSVLLTSRQAQRLTQELQFRRRGMPLQCQQTSPAPPATERTRSVRLQTRRSRSCRC